MALLFAVVVALGAACGASGSRAVHHRAVRRSTDQAARAGGPTTSTSTLPSTTTTAVPPPSPASTAPASAPAGTGGPAGTAGSGGQLLTVTASRYGTTVATFAAYGRSAAGGWQPVLGPWQANVGTDGLAPPGQKREGDGRTPSGTYGFAFFFGDQANPGGLRFPFRSATPSDYWDDDPSSPNYNQWVDESSQGVPAAGANPEPMYNEPAYDYGAVIAYNTSPVISGAGSAIFLHVSTGQPTAGCVALPAGELLAVLRWLDPSQQPRIQMGVG